MKISRAMRQRDSDSEMYEYKDGMNLKEMCDYELIGLRISPRIKSDSLIRSVLEKIFNIQSDYYYIDESSI
jgi:hypothetical protein